MLSLPPEIDRLLPTDEGKLALETLRDCYEDLEALAGDKADIDALTAVKTALVALAAVNTELLALAAKQTELLALEAVDAELLALAAKDTELLALEAADAELLALAAVNDELQNLATDPASFPGDLKVADKIMINETANAKMTKGLTINQGANDDEAIALKSSDVAHGMTSVAETDTYGRLQKGVGAAGGLEITGITDADTGNGYALNLIGVVGETVDTTKSAAGVAAIILNAWQKSGTSVAALDADDNILAIREGSSTRFIFDNEGEMHSDAVIGVGNDWDDWDDLALAADLSRLPKAKWDQILKYHAEDFERAGLITLSTDEEGNRHAFVKHKAMLLFYACCFRDVLDRFTHYDQLLLDNGILPAK